MFNELAKKYFEESYKYYVLYTDNSISDNEYDMLCLDLLNNFDKVPEEYSNYLDKELLKAGSGYSIPLSTYSELSESGLIFDLLEASKY